MAKKRINREFTKNTVTTLAERAHFFCSNPDCRDLTTGPHTNTAKSLRTGEAAHIYGASDTGPRFNPILTDNDIKSIKNGIWLCRICHKKIDSDVAKYPVGILQQWKKVHEDYVTVLQTKPGTSMLRLLKPTVDEIKIAQDILVSLNDKRALFNPLNQEVAFYVYDSLKEVRTEINNSAKLAQGLFLASKLEKMAKAIRTFLNSLFSIDLNTLVFDPKDENWIRFSTSLLSLRKVLGVVIKGISKKYDLPIPQELQLIVPT